MVILIKTLNIQKLKDHSNRLPETPTSNVSDPRGDAWWKPYMDLYISFNIF